MEKEGRQKMQVVNTVVEMREYVKRGRDRNATIGLMATMGNLHAGHASLISQSLLENDITVVSIFVNQAQFAPNEDFDSYPRTVHEDLDLCASLGAQCVFLPAADEVYGGEDYGTWVETDVGRAERNEISEGATRPTFFRGVATLVTKLLCLIQPERTYFGQKDAQQVAVIKGLVKDLWIDCQVVVCETVRESDGLALSSRNQYLTEEDRKKSGVLWQALMTGKQVFKEGVDAEVVRQAMRDKFEEEWGSEGGRVLYVSVCERLNMREIEGVIGTDGGVLGCVAAMVGKARLIDNMVLRE